MRDALSLLSYDSPIEWGSIDTYGELLSEKLLRPLVKDAEQNGAASSALQEEVLAKVYDYFLTDMQERAPTRVVAGEVGTVFHGLMAQIMEYIDPATILGLARRWSSSEIRYSLLSYKDRPFDVIPLITDYDEQLGLLQISYFLRSNSARHEHWSVGGDTIRPRYEKTRGCKFFGRIFCYERIVWIPTVDGMVPDVMIDGEKVEVQLGGEPRRRGGMLYLGEAVEAGSRDLVRIRCHESNSAAKGRGRLALVKKLLLSWFADSSLVQRYFRDAWVFADRDRDADDNAEHLYRWVRENHPKINAWFVIDRFAPDRSRLRSEGFRIVSGEIIKKLLFLNCRYIISSHADLVYGGLDPEFYRDRIRWRFVFLQHGVTYSDMSHWLGRQPFDRLIASSPEEYEAFVGKGSLYRFTEKEVRRTGLPRHDRLLKISSALPREEVRQIVVMPTWRGGFVDRVNFERSEYARRWREVFSSVDLQELVDRHRQEIVFMPHPDLEQFVLEWSLPRHVRVVRKVGVRIQEVFCRSSLMITDYSSVAFEMAYLRRPVIYYQFDRERFFRSDHNWREGYFSFERDGFGPVTSTLTGLVGAVGEMLEDFRRGTSMYLERMVRALPDRDGGACRRVYESIVEFDRSSGNSG